MADILIKDYVQQGEDRLLDQFSNSPIIQGVLSTYLNELSNTQTSSISLLDILNIETAYGYNLDLIGKMVGEERLGNSDTQYRKNIKVKIFLNSSKGTPNDLLEILDLLTESTSLELFEHTPLHSIFYTDSPTISDSVPNTLLQSSPVCSHYVGVIHDPNKNALVPSELEIGGGILIDDNNRDLVTDEDYNIAVNYLTALSSVNSERGILPEIDELSGYRIPAEFYTSL